MYSICFLESLRISVVETRQLKTSFSFSQFKGFLCKMFDLDFLIFYYKNANFFNLFKSCSLFN